MEILSRSLSNLFLAKPLDHLDLKAEQFVQSSPSKVQNEIDVLFANDEYEAKLRYIRNENANRES